MRSKHPNTDAHRAGCPSCQLAHDKQLPDAQFPDGVELSCKVFERFDTLRKAVGELLDMSFDQLVRDAKENGWRYEAAQLKRVAKAYDRLRKAETRG